MTTPAQRPGRSKQDYATPQAFLAAVRARLNINAFAVDLAADASNRVTTSYYSEATNALRQDWDWWPGEWAWLNPPYANIGPWVAKASLSEANIAMLIPASVGANWWKQWVHHRAKALFLNGRLAFMPDKPMWLYPKDCALLLYGPGLERYPNYDIWTWRS